MVVGFDLRALQPGFKAHSTRGIGTYALELARRLPAAGPRHEYRFFVEAGEPVVPWAEDIDTIPLDRPGMGWLPMGRRTVGDQVLFPRALRGLGLDLAFFASHLDAPAFGRQPRVVMVHDLIPQVLSHLYPTEHVDWRGRFGKALTELAARRASGVLVNSEATKRDVMRLLGVPAERIAVTPLAPAPSFRPIDDPRMVTDVLATLGIPRPYLLYLGGIDPRKNVRFLLDVYARLRARGVTVPLVMAGRIRADEEFPALERALAELELAAHVHIADVVPSDALPALYGGALAFLYPSLYEGFGLPPIEAMACGAPVVASDRGSLPEVLGDAALLVDPGARDAYVAAIERVLGDDEFRHSLVARGRARAATYTWERTAAQTVAAFERVLAGRPLGLADA